MNTQFLKNATRTELPSIHLHALEAPREALIQVSTRCNPRLNAWANHIDSSDLKGNELPVFLRPGLFQQLRPILPSLLRVHFYGLGEPSPNPHLTSYIRELSSAGVETRLTTHAALIDCHSAEALARAGVDRLSISIDSARSLSEETNRYRAKLDRLLRGLQTLTDARLRHGNPNLSVHFVATRSNPNELFALVDLCSAFGIEKIHVEPLLDWNREHLDLTRQGPTEALSFSEYRAAVEPAQDWAQDAGIHLETRFLPSQDSRHRDGRDATSQWPATWICKEPRATVYITAAGDVRTCGPNERCFGNLSEASIDEIWNSDAFVTFRHRPRDQAAQQASNDSRAKKHHKPPHQPVSNQLLMSLSEPPPLNQDLAIKRPCEGEVVTDPLVITGRLPAGIWASRESSPGPSAIRSARHGKAGTRGVGQRLLLYIDHTPVSDLGDAVTADGSFLLVLPVPYLSEGAHVLSMGFGEPGIPAEPGWSRRTFQFRQSPESRPDAIAVTRTAAVLLTLNEPAQSARVWIDGEPWSPVEWFCSLAPWCRERISSPPSLVRRLLKRFDRRAELVWRAGVALALDGLAPGRHAMEIRPRRQGAHTVLLERFEYPGATGC